MSDAIRTIGGVPFGPTGLIAAADWTRDRLMAFGIPFPPSNRLQGAQAFLRDLQEGKVVLAPEADDVMLLVTEAQWTIVEQYIVTRALGRPSFELDPLRVRKLREMLSGARTPEDDRNPMARNTQFELFVAALFTMGDVEAVLGEPDILIAYRGESRGVAAKRVRSRQQAVRRANEAADQLAANRLLGFVAVNVDVLLKVVNGGPGPEATLAERLDVINTIESRMVEREHVLGTLTLGRDCIWDFTAARPRAAVSHSYRFTVHPRTDGDAGEAREFFDRMMARIDTRMSAL